MLHVHMFPVAPLGACDMAQAGADEHKGGVAVGEGAHYPGAPADLAVEALMKGDYKAPNTVISALGSRIHFPETQGMKNSMSLCKRCYRVLRTPRYPQAHLKQPDSHAAVNCDVPIKIAISSGENPCLGHVAR